MEITIVFWGLMALVPQVQDGEWTGMSFLMLRGSETSSPPPHVTTVALRRCGVAGCRFETVLSDATECDLWLEFGDPVPDDFRHTTTAAPNTTFPIDADDASRLSWLPRINDFASGDLEKIDPSCVDPSETCKEIGARFRVTQGMLSACHLLHVEAPDGQAPSCDNEDVYEDDWVMGFRFRRGEHGPAIFGFERAMADAVSLRLTGSSATLRWAPLPDSGRCTPGSTSLGSFSPIEVVVGNFSVDPDHAHFKHFFDIAIDEMTDTRRAVPYCKEGVAREMHPGSCEFLVSEYDYPDRPDYLYPDRPDYLPHNRTECDMVLFDP